MQIRGITAGRVLIAVIGLTLVAVGFIGILRRTASPPAMTARPPVSNVEQFQKVRREIQSRDREVLASQKPEGISPEERFGALVRLSKEQDLRARERALEWFKDSDPLVREGVASALGQYDDELSFSKLEVLLEDPNPRVRNQALQALGARPGEGRVAVLRRVVSALKKGPGAGSSEALLRAYEALFGASGGRALEAPGFRGTPEARDEALAGLLRLAQEAPSKPFRLSVLTRLSALAPRDARVLDLLHSFVSEEIRVGGDPANAIRQLAVLGDPWLSRNLPELWKKASPAVRGALLMTFPIICPENRWKYLREVLLQGQVSAELASSALEALAAMRSESSDEILTLVSRASTENVPASVRGRATQILSSPASVADPCRPRGR